MRVPSAVPGAAICRRCSPGTSSRFGGCPLPRDSSEGDGPVLGFDLAAIPPSSSVRQSPGREVSEPGASFEALELALTCSYCVDSLGPRCGRRSGSFRLRAVAGDLVLPGLEPLAAVTNAAAWRAVSGKRRYWPDTLRGAFEDRGGEEFSGWSGTGLPPKRGGHFLVPASPPGEGCARGLRPIPAHPERASGWSGLNDR